MRSPTTGTVALIDAPTAIRVERVTVAEPRDDIEVVQAGPHAYVLNRTAATLRCVGGASFSAGPAVALPASPPASGPRWRPVTAHGP